MATGKVARRTVVGDVAALLDSPEIVALVVDLDGLRDNRGNKGYGARALVGACLVKSLFNLSTWTWVAALVKEHPGLQDALGGCPSVWAMYRFSVKLRENRPALNACLDAFAASLRAQHPDFGRDVAIDASDLPAFANGQRYVSQGGKERERFSDPDASWGIAPPSPPARAEGSTATRFMRRSAPRRACRSHGRSKRHDGKSPTSSPRCSTRSALAASSPRRSRLTRLRQHPRLCRDRGTGLRACHPASRGEG